MSGPWRRINYESLFCLREGSAVWPEYPPRPLRSVGTSRPPHEAAIPSEPSNRPCCRWRRDQKGSSVCEMPEGGQSGASGLVRSPILLRLHLETLSSDAETKIIHRFDACKQHAALFFLVLCL